VAIDGSADSRRALDEAIDHQVVQASPAQVLVTPCRSRGRARLRRSPGPGIQRGAANRIGLLFVTTHSYRIGEGTQLDVARIAEEFLGTVVAIPGFRAYYMIDGGDNTIGSVAIFDTREAGEECDRLAGEFVKERLGGFRLTEVQVTEGKVLASQRSG